MADTEANKSKKDRSAKKSVVVTCDGHSPWEGEANTILQKVQDLQKDYWDLHQEMIINSYPSSHEAMVDAQQLGQLAEAIALLSKAQSKLRCINGINAVK